VIRSQKIVVGVATAVFLCELVAVVILSPSCGTEADAAQRFTPSTVTSVPESFLKGGDRSLAVLVEISETLRENGRKLDKIAQELEELNKQLSRVQNEK
jgi:hypothetical protein